MKTTRTRTKGADDEDDDDQSWNVVAESLRWFSLDAVGTVLENTWSDEHSA